MHLLESLPMRQYFAPVSSQSFLLADRTLSRTLIRVNIDTHTIMEEIARIERVRRYDLRVEVRTPSYCAGCPHRGSSSALLEIRKRFQDRKYMRTMHGIDGTVDIISHGGIGCYSLNFLPPFRDMHNMSAMGLGGAAGMGAYPFTRNKHYVMCGDSTFFHSEMSTLSNAIKDNQDILYIILDNKNTAMTGHQVTAGSAYDIMGYRTIQQDIESVVRGMDSQGRVFIRKIDPTHRDEYLALLEDAFLMEGVRVIIADRECGITYHRRKRAGVRAQIQVDGFTREERHINIADEVCENCRECTRVTGCPGLTIVPTPYGDKIGIDRSTCVDDTYCTKVKACPSFEQVIIRRSRKERQRTGQWDLWMKDIPVPVPPFLGEPTGSGGEDPSIPVRRTFSIFVPGVGGMGLGFIAKLLTEAGAKEGYEVTFYHQKGLAQRNGAVVSHVIFSLPDAPVSPRIPDGKADLILGLDYLETVRGLHVSDANTTSVICNTARTPTITMLTGEDTFPDDLAQRITAYSRASNFFGADFFELAEHYLGNRVYANLMMVGVAYQTNLLPIRAENIEEVIRESVRADERDSNLRAFRLGRRLVSHPEMQRLEFRSESFDDFLAKTSAMLRKKSAAAARTYRDRVAELAGLMAGLPDDARREFARRYYDLVLYENIAFAESYAKRVIEVFYVESQRGTDAVWKFRMTTAVIHNLHKVMAIKDEVWVAHLLTCEEKLARDRLRYNIDTARGDRISYLHINRPRFEIFGRSISWDMKTRNWMLHVMKRMKFLRRLLPSWHRREKTFRDWYKEEVITAYIEGRFASSDDAWRALTVPASCTGYRDVVYPKQEEARALVEALLRRQPAQPASLFPFEPISMN